MRAEDYNKLIKSIVEPDFSMVTECTEDSVSIELRHKCGHCFSVPYSVIAREGVSCNRCQKKDREKLLISCQEKVALKIYDECMERLGPGHTIEGDTSSYDNTVKVIRTGRSFFNIKISDLLNDVRVPVYLMRCTIKEPSVQLQLLQIMARDKFTILTDFTDLEGEVSVVNREEEKLYKMRVIDLINSL